MRLFIEMRGWRLELSNEPERRQAACAHEETVDIRTLCDATLRRLCNDCGAEITEEDE